VDISLSFEGHVALITWNDEENRINLDSLGRLNEILDELAERIGPLAVVWTGTGKFFSNGLDLARLGSSPGEFAETNTAFLKFMGRMLTFPAYTVAALNGHTFAGGALLSCTTDYRIMRRDRGYWCMNELELGMIMPVDMNAVLATRLPRATFIDAVLTARRFSAVTALEAGIIQETAPIEELLPLAVERASALADKDRKVIGAHKRQFFGELAERLGYVHER
jgi:enoyl-CoA hydratase/carnithine racemase